MPPVRPEELLAHSAWLRRLAVSLVGGDADAEDLVQETWIVALRHPPREAGPVQGWLATVLRNLSRMRRRGTGRRQQRELEGALAADAVVDATAPSAEELLERLEGQRRLVALVAALDEPFRAAVLLRYFEGLSSAEIARSEGIPAGTVRWRLKTGLDRLRVALDESHGGDRRRWALLLAPLAPFATGGAPAWSTVLKGLWLMKRTWQGAVLIAVILGLLGAAWWWRGARQSETPAGAAPGTGAVAAGSSTGEPHATPRAGVSTNAAGVPSAPSSSPPESALVAMVAATAEPDPTAASGAFEGRVVNWGSGAPVPGAEITFAHAGATTSVAADGEGRFRFEPAAAGAYTIAVVTAPGFLPFAPPFEQGAVELSARAGFRLRNVLVYLSPAIDYTAQVVGPDGAAIAGAEVRLLGAPAAEQALAPIADRFTSDAKGEVVLHAPDLAVIEARHPGFARGRARLDRAAQTSHRLTIRLGASGTDAGLGGETIGGRVVDATGAPIGGARVVAHASSRANDPVRPDADAETLADGRFTITGLDPGAYTLEASQEGHAGALREAVPAGTRGVTLILRDGGVIGGRVVRAQGGGPVVSFSVVLSKRTGAIEERVVASRAFFDAGGQFTIGDLAPGEYTLVVTAHGLSPSAKIRARVMEPGAAATPPVDVTLSDGGKLVGRVVDTDGTPLPFAKITADVPVGGGSLAVPTAETAITGADGRFELAGLAAGSTSITAGAYGHHARMVSGLAITDGATLGPITIELTPTKPGEDPGLEIVGIGAKVSPSADAVRVDAVVPGGGAEAAGVVAGDAIVTIDGVPVADLGFDGSLARIRGAEGTTVALGVRRASGALVQVVATRRKIRA